MKIRIFSLVILSLCLLVTVSPISAMRVYDTHIDIGSYTVHHGEAVTVKVELFAENAGIFGTDQWVNGATLDFKLLKKDKDGEIHYPINDYIFTNEWGNAYYTIDTSNLEPGHYGLLAYFPFARGKCVFTDSTGSSTLTVT
jgi:hypothetical protein